MKTIYVFGNPLVKEDSLPLELLPKLSEVFPSMEFKELDTTEDLEPQKELVILDTVKGIKKIELINDIDRLSSDKIYTMHDFDLGYTLKLWKKMGMLESVIIIGVPDNLSKDDAFAQICAAIKSILISKNG